ncbi:ankyrin repeat-containing domain protein, partial [Kalaharituber pfeilii]
SPLHLAAFNRHEAICKLLLDQGADVDAKCRENAPTPLHHAISAGSEAIVKLLLGHGAN